jgi:hypothetical protein
MRLVAPLRMMLSVCVIHHLCHRARRRAIQ